MGLQKLLDSRLIWMYMAVKAAIRRVLMSGRVGVLHRVPVVDHAVQICVNCVFSAHFVKEVALRRG